MLRAARATIFFVAVASPSTALAQKTSELHGRLVTDSGVPIVAATVTLNGVRYSVRSDSLGRFLLTGTPGSTLSLSFTADGYRDEKLDVVLTRGRPVVRDFVLVPETTPERLTNLSKDLVRVHAITPDGEPIAYTNLQVNGGRRYVSDDSGRFAVRVPATAGATFLVRRIGFEPTEVRLAQLPDTAVRITMKALATTLEAQVVTVRSPYIRLDLNGFYRRMADVENGARVGYFVTPEDLALRRPQNVTDAVEQFPSIRLAPIDDGKLDASGMAHADGFMSRRKFRIEDRNGCPMTVYLDRVRIQPSTSAGMAVDEEINSIIQAQTVAGIEVYPRAAGAPPEFPPVNANIRRAASGPQGGTPGGLGACSPGVVLIWTK